MLFVIMLFNHLPNANGEIPLTEVMAQIQGISEFMHFHFWQEAFVELLEGGEEKAWWAMPAPDMGDELTWLVISDGTQNMVPCSNVRAAKDPLHPDLRLQPKTNDL